MSTHCYLVSDFNIDRSVQHTLLQTGRHRLNISLQEIKRNSAKLSRSFSSFSSSVTDFDV
jgi:hypothetical protein